MLLLSNGNLKPSRYINKRRFLPKMSIDELTKTEKQLKRAKRKLRRTDALDIYKKNYLGLTSSQLFYENKYLYKRLSREGSLDKIPKNEFENSLEYYIEHYNGLTSGQVYEIEPRLYVKLRKSGELEYLPRIKDLK